MKPGKHSQVLWRTVRVRDKYGLRDKPYKIFNVDEKGITLNHSPFQVVAAPDTNPQENHKQPDWDVGLRLELVYPFI